MRIVNAMRRAGGAPPVLMGRSEIKESIDWREEGIVNTPINQMSCGSCWSFATTGLLEAKLAQFSGTLPKLAEGYLVDCGTDNGCAGGNMQDGLEDIEESQYLPLQTSYGLFQGYYTDDAAERLAKCSIDAPNALEDVWLAYKYLATATEEATLVELQKNPVPVGFYVSSNYGTYESGVFEDSNCGSGGRGHAALIVGYTPEAWIIKNSYGTQWWGEDGYIRLKRSATAGQCGLFDRVWNVELIPRREIQYKMVNGLYTYNAGAAKCASFNTEGSTGWSLGVIPTRMHHAKVLAKFHKKYGTQAGSSIEYNYFWIGMKSALSNDPVWDDGFTKLGFMKYELKGTQPNTYGTLKMAKHTTQGRWSSENPATKLRIICSRTSTCKKLTKADVPNSKYFTLFSNEVMSEGTTAKVVCMTGFVRSGGLAKCVAGQWQLPSCNAKKQ